MDQRTMVRTALGIALAKQHHTRTKDLSLVQLARLALQKGLQPVPDWETLVPPTRHQGRVDTWPLGDR